MSLKTNVLEMIKKRPQTAKQLRAALKTDNKKLNKILKSLVAEKRLENNDGMYFIPGSNGGREMVDGRLVKLGKGFGFVAPLDGSADVFVPGGRLAGAMPEDVVKVALYSRPRVAGSREGEICDIIRPNERITGTVENRDGRLVLVPDSAPDIQLVIKRSADGGVKAGEKAAGQILDRGETHGEHRVGIVQRFGAADVARQCAKAILYAAGITKSFGDDVKNEAKNVSSEKIPKEEIKKRKDFRGEVVFTIDSDSTKDMDDAVSACRTPGGYQLGVHIADVGHYVSARGLLDEEALARGTSIYYADSVIPMLPRSLSNGACSLNPGEDRLTFSCVMDLDGDGRLLEYRFVKSLIRSKVKGIYTEINTLFARTAPPQTVDKYAEVTEELMVMREIYQKLAALRQARGSMEIESDEPQLTLDEDGVCVDVARRTRGEAERLIEEFMLLANTAAAHYARERQIPFVYRVHERPPQDKVEQLKAVLTAAGVEYHFAGETPTTVELGMLLDKTRGTHLEIPVHTAVLRSMAKAKYEPEPRGHFGLALEDYAHFTSPIRRYPDLVIHRILADATAGATEQQLAKRYGTFVKEASAQASARELVAQQIERDCDDCYKAEYMKAFVGQSFDGVVTSVTAFGLYVGLPNTVEGLVHVTRLSEYKMELQPGLALIDPVTGSGYRIGDAIRVKLVRADVSRGQLDFELA